ncbi:hypothetical protein CK228_23170 [Mesorhizobium sp. WSM4312]|uniref:hypothetical protein n=1 Tax=unclassified Mesorhizobium TaxID=325217 RepID=UPI000BAED205|nr:MULTISPECIES: hypothetical protein [unclassified Mesorhizobium]PBB66445.1 hypothetical protein CK228_23170 [Mesorhizobium sp. WSM4312]TRC70592.1 hypothetical protein FJV81_36160 [Mesorhizobium sp. WSM4315]TRC74312.1 hypothetical protein FJV83_36175 [Mesorhizobium sp. WSM4307]
MQVTSDLTVAIRKLLSARSGVAGTSQQTFVKAGTALRTEAPVIRPGATGDEDGTFGSFGQAPETDVPAAAGGIYQRTARCPSVAVHSIWPAW